MGRICRKSATGFGRAPPPIVSVDQSRQVLVESVSAGLAIRLRAPPAPRQQFGMMAREYLAERRRYAEKGQPLFGKHVVRSAVIPGLAADFLFLESGLGHIPKHAIG